MAGYDHHFSGTLQISLAIFFNKKKKNSVQKELGRYQTLVTSGGRGVA